MSWSVWQVGGEFTHELFRSFSGMLHGRGQRKEQEVSLCMRDIKQCFQIMCLSLLPTFVEPEHSKGTFGKIAKSNTVLTQMGAVIRSVFQTVCDLLYEMAGDRRCAVLNDRN